ncbi:hypothetical protein BGZ54_000521, partial [Gamsiella multidivaricata]
MNSTQYSYHPYPSPSQTQAQVPQQQQQQQQQQLSPQQHHQQQVLSPQQQQQQLHSPDVSSQPHPQQQQQQQQQLSPQQSPSPHQHSPEQQHTSHLGLDHNNNNSNNLSTTANNTNNTTNHIDQHPSPSHSNDAQSPIDAEGELIVPGPGATSQQSQQPTSGVTSSALHSPNAGQGHPTTLLPMPSPALAAATAANTAANTNSAGSRQLILQQYQQQQQNMGMSMPPNGGTPGAINTMGIQGPGYMLPSPQFAGTQPPLPQLPPQSTDLDTILAKYANQPELLKLIIASKTEEDRRWAEEARYRMMDLIMRGENRGMGFMAGYEALGGIPGNMPGNMMGMTAKRFMEEGGYGLHTAFGGFPPAGPGLGGAGCAP